METRRTRNNRSGGIRAWFIFLWCVIFAILTTTNTFSGTTTDVSTGRINAPVPQEVPYQGGASFPPIPATPADYSDVHLLIFISSSMPEETIRSYMEAVGDINRWTVFVLRGFVDNETSILPTLKWVQKILCKGERPGSLSCIARTVDVNPVLFRTFGIEMVPAFVIIEEGTIESCSPDAFQGKFFVSYGDADLAYHLSKASKKGSMWAEKLLRALRKSFYD